MDYLKEIKEFHKIAVAPYKGESIGCYEEEVTALERQFGFPFPEACRQFLLWMGKDLKGVFVGSGWFYNDVISNSRDLKSLLTDNKVDFELPAHYLAFFMHQGYMAAWFTLPKESENPVVYFYHECKMARPRIEGKFTEFLFSDMKGMASFLPRLNRNLL